MPSRVIDTRRPARAENTRRAEREARGALYYLVRFARLDRIAGLPADARRDQARASSPVKEKTAVVLDRLRSALLTIPDTLPPD